MTASINVNQYWCDGGKNFEMWLRAYGFKITAAAADVIVTDYDTWINNSLDFEDDSLIVILSSYRAPHIEIPSNALFLLIPLDYPIVIEHIIKLIENRHAVTINSTH